MTSVYETVVGIYDVDQIVVEDTTVTGKLVVNVETETCRMNWVSTLVCNHVKRRFRQVRRTDVTVAVV